MKNKNTIYSIVIILVFVVGLVLMANPGGEKETANVHDSVAGGESAIVSSGENFFDFGDISMSKGKVSHSFAIENTGSNPVIVNKIYTSCMCTTAVLSMDGKKYGPFGMAGHGFTPTIKKEIAPGAAAEVVAIFNPAAHGPAGVGRNDRTVYVETESGVLEFGFTVNVTP